MDFTKTVEDVKGRLETVSVRGQGVAKVSAKTFKAANGIVIDGVQGLVKTNTEAAKDLYTISRESFDKAVADGLIAVATNPIEYLPDGRDTLVEAFDGNVKTVSKTSQKLVKVVKTGYQDVSKTIAGKPLRKPAKKAAGRKPTTRKATRASGAAA